MQVCVLVLAGENPKARANKLLGRFDLVGIPPAPAQQPEIEVTFHVDEDNILHVSAVDLDTGRHSEWEQKKGRVVVHQ